MAFAFGLLHGLGLPPLALFAFNLGVEPGTLLFIAVVLVVGARLRRLYPAAMAWAARPGGRGLGAAGYAMGSGAAVWFVGWVAAF